ncbi:hypothetical protein ACIHAA_06180 [Streptomyces sp. NPDC052040]|uniref:hypothetical protein n=1 Tax=Streptomyces sp. NPDC052040 TaxID=3365682 RepID=UPI0037CDBC82
MGRVDETDRTVELSGYTGCRGDVQAVLPPDSASRTELFTSVRFTDSPADPLTD